MYALGFKIKHTVYHRISTCGGQDSEPGGSSVEETTMTVVVPKNDGYWRHAAEEYILRYNGHSRDKGFLFIGEPTVTQVHGIMREALMRLD